MLHYGALLTGQIRINVLFSVGLQQRKGPLRAGERAVERMLPGAGDRVL